MKNILLIIRKYGKKSFIMTLVAVTVLARSSVSQTSIRISQLVSVDDLNEGFDDKDSDTDDLSKSDFDEMEVEDEYLDTFFTSFNEDALMNDFVSCLQTIDGGKKSLRQSRKHKRVLMGLFRWNPDKSIS